MIIIKLYQYFGCIGIASIIFWMAAAAIAVNYMRHPGRGDYFLRAFAFALAGLLSAYINSHFVGLIEADRTAFFEALAAQQKEQLDERISKAAQVRFAEDTLQDQLDLAGIKDQESMNEYERAVTAGQTEQFYKRSGKQRRSSGAKRSDTPTMEYAIGSDDDADEGGLKYQPYKILPADDLQRANTLDQINLILVRLVFLGILFLMAYDYLKRFNRTTGRLWPMPFAGPFVDSIAPKSHAAAILKPQVSNASDFLHRSARKGETFIYFGPLAEIEVDSISRIHISMNAAVARMKRILIPRVLRNFKKDKYLPQKILNVMRICWVLPQKLGRIIKQICVWIARFVPGTLRAWLYKTAKKTPPEFIGFCRHLAKGMIDLRPLQVLSFSIKQQPFSHAFVFESVWFGRYGFLVENLEESHVLLRELNRFLDMRFSPRAMAKQSVNVVWNNPDPIPPDLLKELISLCTEINFRLVVLAEHDRISGYKTMIDEICLDPDLPEHGPTALAWIRAKFIPGIMRVLLRGGATPEQIQAKQQRKQARIEKQKAKKEQKQARKTPSGKASPKDKIKPAAPTKPPLASKIIVPPPAAKKK